MHNLISSVGPKRDWFQSSVIYTFCMQLPLLDLETQMRVSILKIQNKLLFYIFKIMLTNEYK